MKSFLSLWFLLFIYSFTRRDLNLILYNPFPYSDLWHQTRESLTQIGYYQRPLAAFIYLIFILLFTWVYFKLINQKIPAKSTWLKWFIPLALIGIPAYPMFSHDIFNYIFNAKMVLIYHANPHIRTAMEFAPDPMLRFMHNVHTPAPYAYGWTGLSLLPGLAWFLNKFVLAFWSMKTFVAFFWLLQLWLLKKLIKTLFPQESFRWWLFALSPLVLIETLIIGHNDISMMFPALAGFFFLNQSKKIFDRHHFISLLLLFLSASVKYASIVLLPLWLIKHQFKKVDIATFSSILLFLVMFTRPGQMHSWYFIWAFSFAVLSKNRLILSAAVALSLGALLRYLPYIYYGNWDSPVNLYRQLIWLGSLLFTPFIYKLTDGVSHPRQSL